MMTVRQRPPIPDDSSDSTERTPLTMEDAWWANRGMMEGKYKDSRVLKYDYDKKGKCSKIAMHIVMACDKAFTLYILATAIFQLTDITGTFEPLQTWLIILAIRSGLTFFWWLLAIVCGSINACAQHKYAKDSSSVKELPCPEAYTTITWWTMQLAAWVIAIGFFADFFHNVTAPETIQQDASLITKMWIIIIAVIVDGIDYFRWGSRCILDYMLMCCKSPCYDL